MRVLVTGSSGFIGYYVCKELKESGHYVIGVDKVEQDHDYTDDFQLMDLSFNGLHPVDKFDACIHLASSVGGILHNTSNKDLIYENKNIDFGTVRLCNSVSCDKMIFFSSINVLERIIRKPHDKLEMLPFYTESKMDSERFLSDVFGNFTVIRPTNAFGARQIDRFVKHGISHVIPDLIDKIKSSDTVTVWGDGKQRRNFVHAVDIAKFAVKCLDLSGKHYFSVRSNLTITIKYLVEYLIEFLGKDVKIEFDTSYNSLERDINIDFDMSIPIKYGWETTVSSILQGLRI